MSVPAIFRDFKMHMPTDFEPSATGQSMVVPGMAQAMLDTDGKPVYAGNVNNSHTTTATFAEWYRDTPGTNHTTSGKIALYNNGNGAFVNRWGPNGEQWSVTTMAYYCGNVGREMLDPVTGMPIPCTVNDGSNTNCTTFDAMGYKQVQCNIANGSYTAIYQTALLDGTPVFFPVDGDNFSPASEATVATIPPPTSRPGSYPQEMGMPKHNFNFTSEVRYWFKFDATKSYTLDFIGDDDVWVFVNKKLAVDLGGIHPAQPGSVTLNATTATRWAQGRQGLRGRRVPGRAPDHQLDLQAHVERVQRRAQRVPAGLRRWHLASARSATTAPPTTPAATVTATRTALSAGTAATASSSTTGRTATTASTTATRARRAAGTSSSPRSHQSPDRRVATG